MSDTASQRFPTVNYDPERPDTPDGRAAALADIRGGCPVAWSDSHDGFWLVSRYADCIEVLSDSEAYTTAKYVDPRTGKKRGGNAIPDVAWDRTIPSETESPEWDRYRGVLNPFFTPKAVEARRRHTIELTSQLIDLVIETGRVDFVLDIGNPLSALSIMSILGVPLDDWKRWSKPFHDAVHSPVDSAEHVQAAAEIRWVYDQIALEITRRRSNPGEGMLSDLMSLPLDGDPLNDDELRDLAMQILTGAIETTTALTANALLHLFKNPADRERLQANRKSIPKAFDEFLRYFTPVQGLGRTVKIARELAGVRLHAGDRMLLSYASANRDEAIFDDADTIRLERAPNRHLALGRGQHFCLGSFQARMMFEVMLNAIFDRLSDFEIIESEARRYPSMALVNGWVNMPGRFTPGMRTAAHARPGAIRGGC